MEDFKYIELEEEHARLQQDMKQLTEDNKLMWDLWKQVQMSKPDITKIIATTVEREARKHAAREQHIWNLLEERDACIKKLEEQLDSKDTELRSLSTHNIEKAATEANMRSRLAEFAAAEEKLKDELDQLNRELIDSNEINNRLLVSMEKENSILKKETESLKCQLAGAENHLTKLKANFEAANSSSSTLWSELASYRQMTTIMEAELTDLKSTCADLRQSLEEKRGELERIQLSKEKMANEMHQQSQRMREFEFEIEALQSRNTELNSEIMEARRPKFERSTSYDDEDSSTETESLVNKIADLREELAQVTAAYDAKSAENEVLRTKSNERLNALERLHSEQRAIQGDIDGLNQRIHKEKKIGDHSIDLLKELESSLETERLIALLKQHCRELANDRDVFAARVEKMTIELANSDSAVADLKLRLANYKRDREAEIRKVGADFQRRLADISKQRTGKISAELTREKSEKLVLEKKVEALLAEKRRTRSQLSVCQTRLARESALVSRQHDRIVELEKQTLVTSAKLSETRSQMAARQKADPNFMGNRRRRTRSASFYSTEDSPARKKMLSFDMATQTDEGSVPGSLSEMPSSPSVSLPHSRNSRRGVSFSARQQLGVERMRVARLLRLAADLKTDRMKLRRAVADERQDKVKMAVSLANVEGQLSLARTDKQVAESRLLEADAELVHLRKAMLDANQKIAELSLISPRVDKSVITDQFESEPTSPFRISNEAYEKAQERLAAMMVTEREQNARLVQCQAERDRLVADLALAKERINEIKREQVRERRSLEEQRGKMMSLETQVSSDSFRIKDLTDRLVNAERTDKAASSRILALKRRIEEQETDKASYQKRLDDKRKESDKLVDQLKKAKGRCQHLEIIVSAEKSSISRLDTEFKESTKKVQRKFEVRNMQVAEFRRFVEMYADALADRIRSDRRSVNICEVSNSHRKPRRSSLSKRANSQPSSDSSLVSRAALIAQTDLKLSAEEAAELLMAGSVDQTPPSSCFGTDSSPEAFRRKVANILNQISLREDSTDEDSAQFANRLCDAIFNGFADHLRFLITRPPCCLNVLATRDDKSAVNGGVGELYPQRTLNNYHFNTRSSTIGGLSDSVFSGSPF